jgi:hypothetical protein
MELHHLRLLKPGSLRGKTEALGHSKAREGIFQDLEKVSLLLVHENDYFGVFVEKRQFKDTCKKRGPCRDVL